MRIAFRMPPRTAMLVRRSHDTNPDSLPDELTVTEACSTCGGAWGDVVARFGNEAAALMCLYGHVEYVEGVVLPGGEHGVTHRPLPGEPIWGFMGASDITGLTR